MDPDEERKKLSSRMVEINTEQIKLQKQMNEIDEEIDSGAMNIQELNDKYDGLMNEYDTLDIEKDGIVNRLKEISPASSRKLKASNMYQFPGNDYQPQHPMLVQFEPTAAGFFSCSTPSDEAIEAWYNYYQENGGIGHTRYEPNKKQYKALKKQYGCAIYPAKTAAELMRKLRRKRQNKEALKAMKAEGIDTKGDWR